MDGFGLHAIGGGHCRLARGLQGWEWRSCIVLMSHDLDVRVGMGTYNNYHDSRESDDNCVNLLYLPLRPA